LWVSENERRGFSKERLLMWRMRVDFDGFRKHLLEMEVFLGGLNGR
jgi:hypothetical protein